MHRVVSATEFKTNCLALLDEVQERGGTITVTKRGRPVATLVRAMQVDRSPEKNSKSPAEKHKRRRRVPDDVTASIFDGSKFWPDKDS